MYKNLPRFSDGRKCALPHSMIGTSNHRLPAGAEARGTVPVGESLAGIPWKLNSPVFSGDSVRFRSFKKEAIIFAEYVGFGHVLKDTTREIPVSCRSLHLIRSTKVTRLYPWW